MSYGLHEQLELHEIATFKTICMTKSKTMQGLVSDETLRQLLADDVLVSTRQLQELSSLLTKANS
ncbi:MULTISPECIES: hypothetical protein [Bacillales]|uniref:Spore coat protein n=1 Tax=Brevibacillus brevis (strain 47 / JCM 6285 / NBRC 100599) TaxID=358681 RepID=C0Z4Q0_BREBN|nr:MULTISPECIES: hypothetical protein [Bacillales]KMZ42817.1 hypothetical protein AC624_17755 [Bacillus sp. FJAT-27238]MBH0329589.1 hypothetical protein [Brevibacillus brevis]NQF15674.1 hypothetical protein [Brevibacillus sp. HB1.3]NRR04645.1 hypothetical protein [Brevibacillus sp. RS1.1]TQR30130.1 hypothetical protein C7Y45_26655 [Lysinibacillus sp. SDF0063]